jgi:hypothetical protein
VLKNPVKAKGNYYDTHDCKSHGKCVLDRGWLTMQKVSKESSALSGAFFSTSALSIIVLYATGGLNINKSLLEKET